MITALLEPAYILHYRLYRDTSLLIDFFTHEYGLVAAIARGVRSSKSPLKGILQPFTPLLVSLHCKEELAILTAVEPQHPAYHLMGKHLFSAFYLNELLMKVLQRHDAYPHLYECYEQTLCKLLDAQKVTSIPAASIALRCFEKKLLAELGYGLNLTTEALSQQPILPDLFYQFFPQKGFVLDLQSHLSKTLLFQGKSLLALEQENFSDASVMPEIKRLLHIAVAGLLGQKTLRSRDFLRKIT